jgi:DNA (cytosine-5)-methyltransferase 1
VSYKVLGTTKEKNEKNGTNWRGWVYDTNFSISSLSATDHKQPKQIIEPLLIKENTSKGYMEACDGDSITLDQPNSKTRRGRVGKQISNTLMTNCNVGVLELKSKNKRLKNLVEKIICEQRSDEGLRFFKDNICGTLRTIDSCGDKRVMESSYRIRKLTPRECWRLMGVRDNDFNKLYDISNTQLYKMAGNSIVVDVLMGIFKNLFQSDDGTSGQLQLF